ncbi:MAG: hypothetical protein GX907_02565 [Clostridiaceae bacterium]|nr:hypothetical protein [Clostridiaceae bacterium]
MNRELTAAVRRGDLTEESAGIAARIRNLIGRLALTERSLGLTFPLRNEPNLMPLARELIAEGWRAYLPTCALHLPQALVWTEYKPANTGVEGGVEAVSTTDVPEPMPPGFFLDSNGVVAAPPESWPSEPYAPALWLIPGLGFDREGYRLGRGGGYYDRALAFYAATGEITSVGVAFELSLFPEGHSVPRGKYDLPLDYIVTSKEIIAPGSL